MKDQGRNPEGFIPVHGGYRNLFSYQKAEIIYDGTVYFTNRFFNKYDRTAGQMVQGPLRRCPTSPTSPTKTRSGIIAAKKTTAGLSLL